jgi:adenosylmethionine-8-amino-7-oxononanoate aminotransferase
MCGIELDPPTDGLRWGRRVSAACVRRGVLVRPLGDVVVLMPILTSTADEIERIIDTLAEAIIEVCGDVRGDVSGEVGGDVRGEVGGP